MTLRLVSLIMTNTPRKDWRVTLTSVPRTIGRSTDADVQIANQYRSVSRVHAQVWIDHKGAWIRDLNSSCGTFINGLRQTAHRETRVVHGDRIMLGTLELILLDEQPMTDYVLADDSSESGGDEIKSRISTSEDLSHNFDEEQLRLLSNAEREVLLWVTRGFTKPVEIGEEVNRSSHTVRTQLNSIFKKIGVHSRDELLGCLLRKDRGDIEAGGTDCGQIPSLNLPKSASE